MFASLGFSGNEIKDPCSTAHPGMKSSSRLWQVLGGAAQGESVSTDGGYHMLLGNLCLLGNTLSMAVYYLLAKSLVQV